MGADHSPTWLGAQAPSIAERLFPARVGLPAEWLRDYRRELVTRRIPHGRRHTLTLAF
jgi:hypothetical protein